MTTRTPVDVGGRLAKRVWAVCFAAGALGATAFTATGSASTSSAAAPSQAPSPDDVEVVVEPSSDRADGDTLEVTASSGVIWPAYHVSIRQTVH